MSPFPRSRSPSGWAPPVRRHDIIRIGVATAGGGDPVTWGGSPGGVVRGNNWLEEEFKGHSGTGQGRMAVLC